MARMVYGWLIRRQVLANWRVLSTHDVDRLPLHDDIRFTFAGDHDLAVEARSADEVRAWLRALFTRFPRLRFEVDEVVAGGPPWSLRIASRYRAVQDGETIYRGAQFAWVRNGRLVEEHVLPDTQAVARHAPR